MYMDRHPVRPNAALYPREFGFPGSRRRLRLDQWPPQLRRQAEPPAEYRDPHRVHQFPSQTAVHWTSQK